jgi:hypothetical protein
MLKCQLLPQTACRKLDKNVPGLGKSPGATGKNWLLIFTITSFIINAFKSTRDCIVNIITAMSPR